MTRIHSAEGEYLQLVHSKKELAELSQRLEMVELPDPVLCYVVDVTRGRDLVVADVELKKGANSLDAMQGADVVVLHRHKGQHVPAQVELFELAQPPQAFQGHEAVVAGVQKLKDFVIQAQQPGLRLQHRFHVEDFPVQDDVVVRSIINA
ncbi:hypothetical protein EYF80_005536 [Liparis tanakae]|uniref:Uncharacterized protein n=1 Tax=Liparis tanakae TaxID=230148 RepID=A0A4Z2J1V0_9TELE|nr:hypothetical protein EYF80_005536 [Liparis tanakae]